MKKIWKWILGIVLVLVVVGSVAAVAFLWRGRAFVVFGHGNVPQPRAWSVPNGPRTYRFDGSRGPMTDDRGWDSPMRRSFVGRYGHAMKGYGFFPFFGGFMFLGWLLQLALFGLLLFGAYWLGKRNARNLPVAPVVPASEPPAPAAEPNSVPESRGRKVA